MPRSELTTKLSRWVDGGIDLTRERFLGRGKRLDHIAERNPSDDQNVHVALGVFTTGGKRSVQKRGDDSRRKRL